MSDPQPDRLKPRPPRAAPLQPDQPFRDDSAEPAPQDAELERERAAEARRREQAQTALDNTRNGYR